MPIPFVSFKSTVQISSIFVAFLENMNFKELKVHYLSSMSTKFRNSLIAPSNLYLDHSSHDMFAFFPYSHQKTFFSSVYPYVPERIVWTNDTFQYLKS